MWLGTEIGVKSTKACLRSELVMAIPVDLRPISKPMSTLGKDWLYTHNLKA